MKLRLDKIGAAALPYMVIFVAIIVIVAAFAVALMGGFGGDDDSSDMTATIYIADEDGNTWKADVDLDEPTWGEQAIMQFGGIRETTFQPMAYSADVAKIWQYGKTYTIWAVVTVRVSGENMQSLNSVSAVFSGVPGDDIDSSGVAPQHDSWTNYKLLSGTAAQVMVAKTTGLEFGQDIVLDQSSAGKFNGIQKPDGTTYTSPTYSAGIKLPGDCVDGALINVRVTASGTMPNSLVTNPYAEAQLKISVGAWDSAKMSVSITGMSGSVN